MDTFKTPKGTVLPMSKIQGKDYLLVAHRLVWFREEHADWGIETDVKHEQDSAVARTTVRDVSGRIISTGTKYEDRQGFPDFIEKAETGSVGRALAMCGYGTQFAPDLDEGERLADSPIKNKKTDTEVKSGGILCSVCREPLVFRQKSNFWGCKNYADQTKGRHDSLKPDEYAELKAQIESAASEFENFR